MIKFQYTSLLSFAFNGYTRLHSLIIFLPLKFYYKRYGTSVLEDNFVARIYTSYDSEGQFLGNFLSITIYFAIILTFILYSYLYIHIFA